MSFENAGPRKGTNKGRKKRQTAILTEHTYKRCIKSRTGSKEKLEDEERKINKTNSFTMPAKNIF